MDIESLKEYIRQGITDAKNHRKDYRVDERMWITLSAQIGTYQEVLHKLEEMEQ